MASAGCHAGVRDVACAQILPSMQFLKGIEAPSWPCSLEMLKTQNLARKCREEFAVEAKAICRVQIAFNTNETNGLYLGKCFHFHIIPKFGHGSPGKVLEA